MRHKLTECMTTAIAVLTRISSPRQSWPPIGAVCLGMAILMVAGCSKDSTDRFTPKEDLAQKTLAMVLDGWQSGKAPEQIDGTAIRVADTQRRPGQTLKSYEILGELPADSGRRFQVKLVLDNPAAEQKAQYVIVGVDPLHVFRQEDYDMMTHWDHPMPAAEGKPKQ